ncbi:MAG TPA: tail fiber domain-containing protein, partial [Stellaceae bacterium]
GSAVYGTLGYAGGGNLTLTNSVGPVVLSASTSIVTTSNVTNQADIFQPSMPASAASANMVAASGNNWQRLHSTSSGRYKANVRDLPDEIADRLLALRPVAFTSLCEADDPEALHYGFIAEEIAEIDPRLVQFGYDGPARKDEPMVPTGLEYNELIALLTATAQRQAEEIQALHGRLAKLEKRQRQRKAK